MIYRRLIIGLFWGCFSLQGVAAHTLIFAIDLVRHGDRTPVQDLPVAPYQWNEPLGELTPTGMNQAYQLGTLLRKKYIETAHLLPEHYRPGTMYVRSTDMNRTLMTATSLLYGLYPLGSGPHLPDSHAAALPQAFQPIPIHTVPLNEDKLLYVGWQERNTPGWCEQHLEGLHDKLHAWSQATGYSLNTCQDVCELGDALRIRKLYHVPLPTGLNSDEAEEIVHLSQDLFVGSFNHPDSAETTGARFLYTVADYLNHADERSPLKYVLFVAHDSTILSVMNALGAPLEQSPPYVAQVSFLLEKKGEEQVIKVLYNNKVVEGACSKLVSLMERDASKVRCEAA